MENKTHRSLTEAYTAMIAEETTAATKGKMLACAADLEDMLEGNEKTKDLCKKAESLQRAIRKAFKEPKVEDESEATEMEEGFGCDDEEKEND